MKRLLLLFFIAATTLSAAEAQVQRELKTEDNGFKWYQTHSGSYYGAESADGRTIVPLSKGYDMIVFHEKGDCIGYFGVYRNDKKGAYDIHGNLVIEPIHEKLYYLSKEGFYYKDAYGNDHNLGITLDANGRASSTASGTSTASTYTPSTSSTSTVSSSSSSESSIDFIFNYYYDGVTGKNVFALDKENKYFFCGQFIMRYEFYNSFFRIRLIAANRRDGTEREVERHVIYPAQCTIVVKSSEHIIVWNDGGKDRNVFIRPDKNMVFLYDVSDLKQQHLFNGKAEGTINTLFNTLSSDSDAEGCTITIEKDYSGKCNRLISRLLQYSWGKKLYK